MKCPKCGSKHIYYVEQCENWFEIESVDENGQCDLGGLHDSFPEDSFKFFCTDCDDEMSRKEFLELRKKGKKHG